jgi:hypothetical protein
LAKIPFLFWFPEIARMTVEMYRRQIQEAGLEKLAVLIRICGFLLQSKVYLFWRKEKAGAQNSR